MPEIFDYDPPRPWAAASRVGDLLFLSGETGVDPVTLETAPGGIEAQTEQALSNIARVLAPFGAGLDDVAKLCVFLTDIEDLGTVGRVKARHFTRTVPSSTVAVTALAREDLVIEIEAIVQLPETTEKGE